MKISVITAVFNSATTLEATLRSLAQQRYDNIEHIVMDGNSTDTSLEILKKHATSTMKIFSEPDSGIYNALNKGILHATGDVIGFLHADDYYAEDTVLNDIASAINQLSVDVVYGDLDYVGHNSSGQIIRHWQSGQFHLSRLSKGWMPPHPTLYIKRSVFDRIGGFDERFRIAADYDFMLRLLTLPGIQVGYIPKVLIKMRIGGKSSSVSNLFYKSFEDYVALKTNSIGGIGTLLLKNISKVPQFFKHGWWPFS
ncbi:MAG: glycosyltransferase [Deltaproteobacteria bacterium]|nr:glycosyltransferase [Deltaproteobacteria bacterium]